jgi:uncharacterized protein YjbJ (UPF0337 family)
MTLTRRHASIACTNPRRAQSHRKGITVSILKRIRHQAQTAKGAVRHSTGRVTGNRRLRTKGRAEKARGNAKQAADKVKDAFKH